MSKVEYVVLFFVICIVWLLMSLPIVFYHLPVSTLNHLNQEANGNSSNATSPPQPSNQVCSSPVVYKGTVCHDILLQYRSCFPDVQTNKSVLVPPSKSTVGSSVMEKLEIVKLFALSEECSNQAVPLLCLFYFGPLCDTKRMAYKVSTAQCLELSLGVCQREWQIAKGYVPDCYSDAFGNETVLKATCATQEERGNETRSDLNGNCSLHCAENFFCRSKFDTKSCVPNCNWKEHPEPSNSIIDGAVIFSASVGVVFGVLVMISACIRRERLCSFPSVIIVYQTIAAVIIAAVILIGYTNRTGLFCRSNDLLESIRHATPFCVISGMVTHYLLLLLTLLWLCHISVLFWKLRFPFQAREFEIANRMKYIHIACTAICCIVSFLPILVISLNDVRRRAQGLSTMGTAGFGITRFPTIICTAVNKNAVYYSLILPINLIVPVGVTLLVLGVWLIYKHHRNSKSVEQETGKVTFKIGTAEKKASAVLCYYVVVTLIGLSGLTIVTRNATSFAREVLSYFACERHGYNQNDPCDRRRFEHLHRPGLVVMSFVLVGLFPLFNFIFTTNLTETIKALTPSCLRTTKAVEEKEKEKGPLLPGEVSSGSKTPNMEMSSK